MLHAVPKISLLLQGFSNRGDSAPSPTPGEGATGSKELPGPNDNSAQAEKPSSTGLHINYTTAIRRSTSDEDLLLEKERLRV